MVRTYDGVRPVWRMVPPRLPLWLCHRFHRASQE